ncbi:MAG: ATP-binding protein, partial [Rivularia sp. (in: cyanobacteria)]
MKLNFQRTRDLLYEFQFQDLFIEQLGWDNPTQKPFSLKIKNVETLYITSSHITSSHITSFHITSIAESSGVAVFEVTTESGEIPDAKIRAAIHKEVSSLFAENLLIFIDKKRTRSLWYWVKRECNVSQIRDHLYVKGQPGDLFLSKLGSLVIDITELENDISVVEIAHRLQA